MRPFFDNLGGRNTALRRLNPVKRSHLGKAESRLKEEEPEREEDDREKRRGNQEWRTGRRRNASGRWKRSVCLPAKLQLVNHWKQSTVRVNSCIQAWRTQLTAKPAANMATRCPDWKTGWICRYCRGDDGGPGQRTSIRLCFCESTQ